MQVGGRYRILESLGSGGHAVVYRAMDEVARRVVALKRPHAASSTRRGTQGRLRFRREFHTMAGLRHPCIVEVYDFGLDAEGPYYTMELLEGRDLRQGVPMPPAAACEMLRQACAALGLLHGRGLVHRDVAPGNLRRDAGGRLKLIDFGLTTTFGVPDEIAGTPPYVSPEAVRGLPLDHRADIFGLGALAYYLLTGARPFAADDLLEVAAAYRHRPAPPSSLAPEVSPRLDALVMSMLEPDPLARPSSAAEVALRLAAIADLPPAPELEVAVACFASAALVGRGEEMARLRAAVAPTTRGQGAAILVEARSGAGKSRLLHELSLQAQLGGLAVARVIAMNSNGAYGVLRGLARELLAAAPEDAEKAARADVEILARIVPELRARFPGLPLAKRAGDAREERGREQRAALAWLVELSKRRPIALMVDDLQRCDEPSCALLAALAFQTQADRGADRAGVLLVTALRTDDQVRAPEVVEALQLHADRLLLEGLSRADTRALLVSIFGEVPGLDRLAQWVYAGSGGAPLHCFELARHLVERGVIRDAGGTWVVAELAELGSAPARLMDAIDSRIGGLSSRARGMGEALAVYNGEMPLALCADAVAARSDEELLGAAEELERAGVVARSPMGYRFQHDGFREGVQRALDAARGLLLHRNIGESLARELGDGDGAPAADVRAAGWHLYFGGEEERGGELLERAGRQLAESHAWAEAISSLEIAVRVSDKHSEEQRRSLELRRLILEAAATTDRDAVLRHAPAAIRGFGEFCGMPQVLRWSRWIGRPLAFVAGMGWAALRYFFSRRRRRLGPPPAQALIQWAMSVGFSGTVHAPVLEVEELERVVNELRLLGWVPGAAPRAAFLMMDSVLDFIEGRYGREQEKKLAEALRITLNPRGVPPSLQNMRIMASGMVYSVRAMNSYHRYPVEDLAALRGLGFRFFESLALYVEANFWRYYGDEARACELEEQAAISFVQLGSSWMIEIWAAVASAPSYALNRDLAALRRTIGRLDALVDAGFSVGSLREYVRGEYQRELGSLDAARATLSRLVASPERVGGLIRLWARIALADTLLASGEYAAAAEQTRKLLSGTLRLPEEMRATWVGALAEAALGDAAGAAQRLDAALERATPSGIPSVCGQLHEARARVALELGDGASARVHLAKMGRFLLETGNPTLIRLVKRLEEEVDGPPPSRAVPEPATARSAATLALRTARIATPGAITEHLGGAGPLSRARRVLAVLLEITEAGAGWIYQRGADGRIDLLAGDDDEPPVEAGAELAPLFSAGVAGAVGNPDGWLALPLCDDAEGRSRVVAVALLARGDVPLRSPEAALCDLLGESLQRDNGGSRSGESS